MAPPLSFDQETLERGVRRLARRDPVLRGLARHWGAPTFEPHNDYFGTLVRSIVNQQISGRAAESILRRLADAVGEFTPERLNLASDEALRSAGISPQKLGYLRSLVEHVRSGELELGRVAMMNDDDIVRELTAVKGIGIWTAQMFLIFSLARFDVLPTGDLGVRKGMRIAYQLADLPAPSDVERIAQERQWAPFRSVASWYMWRALEE